MLFKKINLISSFENNYNKEKNQNFLNKKFIEDEYCSFFEDSFNLIKSMQREEKGKENVFEQLLEKIKNYRKIKKENKNNIFNKYKRFTNVKDEMNIIKKRKQIFPYIIGLKKRSYLFEANTSLINNDKLKYNHDSFSNEGNSRNNEFNNNSLNKFNYSSFNDTSHINKKTKYLESMNSKIKLNILRKRIHINNNSIKNRKKLLNTTIKGIKNIKSQNNNLSQNENCNKSNINSNEINSDINDKKNKTYYKSIPRQKYSLKNFFVEQNYLKIYGKKLKWENKIKLKKNLSIFKIKMKYGQKQKDDNLSKLKDNNGFQTESVSSMDRRYEYIIKPKSLKNFSERNSNTTVKNII